MKIIKGIEIIDYGDPSVGIFLASWKILGEMPFENEDIYNQFKKDLLSAFECFADFPVIKEIKDNEYLPNLSIDNEIF